MTNEEAIKQLVTWVYYTSPEFLPPMQVVEALRLAVDVLNHNFHTRPDGKPLTLEQLRGMDGQPVWIMESPDWGHWELSEDAEDYIAGRDTFLYGSTYPDHDCKGGVHQLRWIAYAYPPAHIDRDEWEPCGLCGTLNDEIMCKFSKKTEYDQSTTSRYAMARFCPNCGRPLTEEGWAELGKRVRG